MRALWLAIACAGCGFETDGQPQPPSVDPFDPSNLDDAGALAGVTGGLDLGVGSYVLDTSQPSLAVSGGAAVDLGGGRFTSESSMTVLALDHLSVAAGATVRVIGDRALLVLVRGDVTIDGRIDASGGCAAGVWCAEP